MSPASAPTGARKLGIINKLCSCTRCGALVVAAVGQATVGGHCSNCGSYELVPLNRATTTTPRSLI